MVGALALAGVSTAASATTTSMTEHSGTHCAILVGKAPEQTDVASPIIARECSSRSPEDARKKMLHTRETELDSNAETAPALLMTWYEDANYGGDSASIYGDYGPCDSAGYRLQLYAYQWSDDLSSASGTWACDRARFHSSIDGSARAFNLPVPYLGDHLNDAVSFIEVWNDPGIA